MSLTLKPMSVNLYELSVDMQRKLITFMEESKTFTKSSVAYRAEKLGAPEKMFVEGMCYHTSDRVADRLIQKLRKADMIQKLHKRRGGAVVWKWVGEQK